VVFRFLAGYKLAVACLSLLFILTWLSTLEQPEKGLYLVQQRYYSADSWFVSPDLDFIPKIKGNSICPPLPSAYLVSIVLFINLTLGGLIRIRKDWKRWGVILAHFSMVGLLVAGFVAHHYSREGLMMIYEGETSDYAQSYTEYINVTDWLPNADLFASNKENVPHVVKAKELNPIAEANQVACKISLSGLIDRNDSLQLHSQLFEEKIAVSEKFNQDSIQDSAYTIKMNEPLRHGGYTLFQAKWIGDTHRPQSGFAVVNNPADQWPKYCLYLATIGLTAHFGMQLTQFLLKRNSRR